MTGVYYQNFICRVLDESTTDSWGIAVNEWDIVDCEEDDHCASL